MTYPDQFEPCMPRHDLVFVGIENADTRAKAWHLCPYSKVSLKYATSFDAMKERINISDKIIKQFTIL